MKSRLSRLFALLMLLSFATQPLLVQARAVQDTTSPCPMQMQQMEQNGMAAHGDCTGHSSEFCSICDLCGHSGGSVFLPSSLLNSPVSNGVLMDDTYRSVFVSIALPVDFPPPRSL